MSAADPPGDGSTAVDDATRAAWRARWRAASEALAAGLAEEQATLLAACDAPDALLDRPDPAGGWSARQVLEHVGLAQHFLLVLADKCANKSARRRTEGRPWPAHAPRLEPLAHLAGRDLAWVHPEHMGPGTEPGRPTAGDLRARLAEQEARARRLLADHAEGQGTLHRIRMSVVGGDDDRLDLVQYLECLRLHRVRHRGQLARLGLPPA